MSSPGIPKNVGCWSGLRALVNNRNRAVGQSCDESNNPICPDPAANPATTFGDLPPAYQTPSPTTSGDFCCTWPALKQEKAIHTPTKDIYSLPFPEAATSDQAIQGLDELLRELSLEIHGNYAHDTLTQFLEEQGFHVTRHYLADQLPGNTAWRGEFVVPGKTKDPLCVVGLNSEMDALPGVGHACGHNLIAIAGVAAALGLKGAMEQHGIPGKIVILGTPSEEGGMGKEWLIRAGAYKEMDICLMTHPGPGDPRIVASPPSLALQSFVVEYHGQTAHAGAAPWEGRNALDAAFIAYTALSALRQQVHPSSRIHGIIEGRDWAPNVIPDYARMKYIIRCPTWEETLALRSRVNRCFEAAAHATSCTMTVNEGDTIKDLRQNTVLADEFAAIMSVRHGYASVSGSEMGASTDFGNVTFELPSIHPMFSIPTVVNGGNHTLAFTAAARTPEAHKNTIAVSKGLAAVGLRALLDKGFLQSVKSAYKRP